MAVATGMESVGPTGLKRSVARLSRSKTPVVYLRHQPRRGGIISAGAARPRGSKEQPLLSAPVAVATGRGIAGPTGLKRRTETGGFKQV